ncbi:MAG: glycosyl hydrolase 115 family protein, partial [Prevotellaceae bacterium]|nr:glycosyl hydrolase 115 family protein [Prevotellaceae bacterium]
IYTIGMRGVHDGPMQGVSTMEEHQAVMTQVLRGQRELLRRYVNPDVTAVPQVFIPYKEVLDLYHAGLDVPDDVTLMWTDDNYGYIQHFPTAQERARAGGNGIYYHVSYWGRPHDYLWLGTFSPYLLYQQMKAGYDNGIRRMWILNVGDIKPAEYQIQLFMDMAWDMEKIAAKGVTAHLQGFLQNAFGNGAAELLLPLMQAHYRLAYIHKPEFMGNTQTEVPGTSPWRAVHDLPWSEGYIQQRLADYNALSDKVESVAASIPDALQDAYLQLVKYPVQAAGQMNRKLLCAQLARHGLAAWSACDAAFDSIASLTRLYNTGIHNQGKWLRMMDFQPRRLPVFEPVVHTASSLPMPAERPCLYRWNGTECAAGAFSPCEGLGYEGKAAAIAAGKEVVFEFYHPACDSIEVEVQLLPTRPVSGEQLRFRISLDNGPARTMAYETVGRSEEWKINVLWNRALRRASFSIKNKKRHRLSIGAVDEGVVLDQVRIYQKGE